MIAASAAGAAALAAAQLVDMRVTGREASATPVVVVERLLRRPVPEPAQSAVSYAAQSSVAVTAAVLATLARGGPVRRVAVAYAAAVGAGAVIDPALGASAWPWRWSAQDWARELALKGALALAVAATL